MNDKIQGFILSISDYKESDVILQVLTKQYGILSLVGKASKKLDSKNHFLPMCNNEFIIDYKDNKTIYSIHNSKVIDNYFRDDDIVLMSFKNVLLELTLKNKDVDSYDELNFVFKNINNDNKYLLGAMYFSYMIKQFGITPIVDSCTMCASKKVVGISSVNGGFVCKKHLNGETILPVDRLKKFRLIIKAGFNNYDVIKDFDYDINDFYLLANFYLDNCELRLKSYDFFRKIV